MNPLLVLDVHYLCHRAFHTTQSLSWKERPTGVLFGFLKSLSYLKDEFQTDDVVFCFEHHHLIRKDIFPEYKKKRRAEMKPEEIEAYQKLHLQINLLRKEYLPKIGFSNVFCFDGYESDDVMAMIAMSAPKERDVILITADNDMLQCLSENVMMYSPQKQKLFTAGNFYQTYKLAPRKWAVLKAITGCQTDEVPGIKGVGEITALKYLRGELNPSSWQYRLIRSPESKAIVRRNRQLVKLPFEGCPVPILKDDRVTKEGWGAVCEELGMKSLAQRPPVSSRKLISRAKSS